MSIRPFIEECLAEDGEVLGGGEKSSIATYPTHAESVFVVDLPYDNAFSPATSFSRRDSILQLFRRVEEGILHAQG